MQVSSEKLEGGKVALSVTLEPEALSRKIDEFYRDVARRASIPGFRKGKVPRALLERQFTPEMAQAQAIEDLVDEVYPAALDEAGLEPLDKGELESADVQEDGSLVIKTTLTVRPEVQLGEYKGLPAVRRRQEVTDDMVQAEVDRFRARYATFQPVEDRPIKEGDMVVVDYDLYADGAKLEGKSVQGYPLEVGADRIFPELNEALEGAGPGQEVRFTMSYPADLPDADLAGKTVEVVVVPKSVRERRLPTEEETAQRLGLQSAEELRSEIREGLTHMAEHEAEHELEDSLIKQVVESSFVEAPEVLVEREMEHRLGEATAEAQRRNAPDLDTFLRRNDIDPDEWRAEQEVAARADVKRALIVDEIGRRENVEVSEEQIATELAGLAERRNETVEQTQKALGKAGLRRLVNRLYEHNIVDLLVANAQITDEPVAAPAQEEPAPAEKPARKPAKPKAKAQAAPTSQE